MVGLRRGLSLTLCAKLVLLTIELCGMPKEINRMSLMTVLHQQYLTIEVEIFGRRLNVSDVTERVSVIVLIQRLILLIL